MFRQMYTRSSFEVLIDYNTYVWIAQLFILGLVVGYMRDQIRIMRLERQELEEHLHRQIVDIRDINESNVRVKEVMEQQLIDHKDSIGKIYSITAGLEQRMPDEVIFYAVEMLGKLMKTKDVALYNVVSKDYARIFSASSQKARSLGNSIRYREMTDIYDALKEQKVYINKKMDEQYPLMARGIYEGEDLCCVLLFPCVASASPLSIQPSVSTLGVGVDISYRQNSFIAYRLSAFTQPFDTKIKLKGIQYKTEDSSHSVGLLLDIFSFENAFRISAGAYYFKLDTDLSMSVDAINPIYEELINQTSGKATWESLLTLQPRKQRR